MDSTEGDPLMRLRVNNILLNQLNQRNNARRSVRPNSVYERWKDCVKVIFDTNSRGQALELINDLSQKEITDFSIYALDDLLKVTGSRGKI